MQTAPGRAAVGRLWQRHRYRPVPGRLDVDRPALVAPLLLAFGSSHLAAAEVECVVVAQRLVAQPELLAEGQPEGKISPSPACSDGTSVNVAVSGSGAGATASVATLMRLSSWPSSSEKVTRTLIVSPSSALTRV